MPPDTREGQLRLAGDGPLQRPTPPPRSASTRSPQALFERGIEVPVIGCPAHPGRMLRVSAQLYNEAADYETLGLALEEILAGSA